MAERNKEYIEAAKALRLSDVRIIFRHLLPNVLPSIIVIATTTVARAISTEATLSFLGIGLPITEPSLGLLISNGFRYLLSGKYWISFYPGIALVIVIVSLNMMGDRLRDVLNPRLKR
jgi:peptide/nickel transport system permease protein